MARLTATDAIIRRRWADFLAPLVGTSCPVSVAVLTEALSKIKVLTGGADEARDGDNRAEVYAWKSGKQTPRAETAFAVGEALRGCGIGWSTGLGALWAAGYLGEYARTLANYAQEDGVLNVTCAPTLIVPDHITLLGTLAPLCASPGLALDLHADAERLDKARHSLAVFAGLFSIGRRAYLPPHKGQHALAGTEWLAHAAALGDEQKIEIGRRERHVWMEIVEWAIDAASPMLLEGRLAEIVALWGTRLNWLMESAAARHLAKRARPPFVDLNSPKPRRKT